MSFHFWRMFWTTLFQLCHVWKHMFDMFVPLSFTCLTRNVAEQHDLWTRDTFMDLTVSNYNWSPAFQINTWRVFQIDAFSSQIDVKRLSQSQFFFASTACLQLASLCFDLCSFFFPQQRDLRAPVPDNPCVCPFCAPFVGLETNPLALDSPFPDIPSFS